jgi:cell division protein FtsW
MLNEKTFMKNNSAPFFFLLTITCLIIIGFIFIYSASSVFALEKCGSPHYFIKKQFFGFLLGIAGLITMRLIPLTLIQRFTPLIFFSSFLLTALTLLPWTAVINGSRRWLMFGPLGFQPSEILKLSLILYIAYMLSKKQYYLSSFLYSYVPFLVILSSIALILLRQPDFGLTVVLCLTTFMLFFIAHLPLRHLFITGISVIPLTAFLIYQAPYRFNRILNFLNPWKDPQGAGFQIIQSFIAIGAGNVAGVGIAQSKQKFFYLPMQHTDFIFSIIAEETGFIGSTLLIMLYITLLYTGIKIAMRMTDPFRFFIVTGYIILWTLQTMINLCVVTGLLPTKGIGLPFVSYGNSALVIYLCMVGLILNCVHEEKNSSAALW